MDALPYVDTLVREYLLFRGFTNTLHALGREMAEDRSCGFQAERIAELVFERLIPQLEYKELMEFLEFLGDRFYSHLDSRFESTIRKLEASILRSFLVTAIKAQRPEKVQEFFTAYGEELLEGPDGAQWRPWCSLAFIRRPQADPAFQAYFSPEWQSLLEISFRNFMTEVLAIMPLPAVLRFNADRRLRLQLVQQVDSLQRELAVHRGSGLGPQELSPKLPAPAMQHHPHRSRPQAQRLPQSSQQQQQQQQQQQVQHSNAPSPSSPSPVLMARIPYHVLQAPSTVTSATQTSEQAPSGVPSPLQPPLAAAPASSSLLSGSSGIYRHHHHRAVSLDTWHMAEHLGGNASADAVSPSFGAVAGKSRHSRTSTSSSGSSGSVPMVNAELHILSLQPQEMSPSSAAPAQLYTSTPLPPSPLPDVTGPMLEAGLWPGATSATDAAASPPGSGSKPGTLTSASGGATTCTPDVATSVDVCCNAEPREPAALQYAPPHGAAAAAGLPSSSGRAADSPLEQPPAVGRDGGTPTAPAGSTSGSYSSPCPSTVHAERADPALAAVTSPFATANTATTAANNPLGSINASLAANDCAASQWAVRSTRLIPAGTMHRASITCCAFSPSGQNVATASADGAVAIWSVEGTEGNESRHGRLQCSVPVTVLAWDARADKTMLVGTQGSGMKAWHADTRRVIADIPLDPTFPTVAALACSPLEPMFVCATSSKGAGGSRAASPTDSSGKSSPSGAALAPPVGRLALWNMRAFKRTQTISVPNDAPVCSLAFNRSGSWLAAATAGPGGTGTGSAVHLYDLAARSQPVRSLPLVGGRSGGDGSRGAGGSPPSVRMLTGDENCVAALCGSVLQVWSLAATSAEPLYQADVFTACAGGATAPIDSSMWPDVCGDSSLSVGKDGGGAAAFIGTRCVYLLPRLVLSTGSGSASCSGRGLWSGLAIEPGLRAVVAGDWHPTQDTLACGGRDGALATVHLQQRT